MSLNKEDGDYLIKLAKKSIETYLTEDKKIQRPEEYPETLNKKYGIFVTLNHNEMLRGCIGYPEPVAPLIDAVVNIAIASAFEDPRFPPLTEEEFKDIDLEITVLTEPELIEVDDSKEYPNKIKIGEDGLIVQYGYNKGLLLPQVAEENGFNEKEFLSHTCLKANLYPDSWLEDDVEIYKFQGQIFK